MVLSRKKNAFATGGSCFLGFWSEFFGSLGIANPLGICFGNFTFNGMLKQGAADARERYNFDSFCAMIYEIYNTDSPVILGSYLLTGFRKVDSYTASYAEKFSIFS